MIAAISPRITSPTHAGTQIGANTIHQDQSIFPSTFSHTKNAVRIRNPTLPALKLTDALLFELPNDHPHKKSNSKEE